MSTFDGSARPGSTRADYRRLLLEQRKQAQSGSFTVRSLLQPNTLVATLVRLAFLLMVVGVLLGVWMVSSAHLAEQFLGAPQSVAGLIDPNEGKGALTPDNIENQVLAYNLRLRENELDIPAGTNARQRPFVINLGEPARFVAARLAAQGFVLDADLFNLYLRVTGLERRIQAGNFMLSETMNMREVAQALQQALEAEATVTIPEGFRAEEIADRLAAENIIEFERFMAAVRQPRTLSIFADYEFLQSLPGDASLEGYLFPDTYRFPVFASTPEQVIAPFLNNFVRRVGSDGLAGGRSGYSGRELINLAAIVEREAVHADERPLIASVYLNRLNGVCQGEVGGRYLQADPTVQYARGVPGNWWWKPQRIEEYAEIISPYNTYLNQGLPPGPIANPGLDALTATQNPAQTAYCFFVATGEDGRHVFAQTLAEHEQNMRNYGYQ
ncbi:MAG: endolytic transglycosylase MltG [Caldilineaceae bacterium]|nr:endolytic transglycosylase MltG [Caldilineaceae bacterium]